MRRSMWPVALVGLLVVDALLIFWALRPAGDSSAETPVTSSSSSPSTSSATTSSAAAKADRVIVKPINTTNAWRVLTGSTCSGSATLSRSQDAGATWAAGPKLDLKMVSSVTTDASGRLLVSGLDAGCKPATRQVDDSGAKASDDQPLWAVNPADASTLLHSGKATAKACPAGTIKDLATDTEQRANVLCDEGEIRRTVDAGATWSKVGTVKNATGISTASAGQGYRVYVASDQACGVRVAALAHEAAGSATGCVDGSNGAKGADIALWGRTIWVADQTKAWQVPTTNSAVAQSSSSSTQSTTESSTSSTQEPSSTSGPVAPSSSTQQWTPSSTSQWTPTRTRTSTYVPPSSPFTPPVEPTTVEPPATGTAGSVGGTSLGTGSYLR